VISAWLLLVLLAFVSHRVTRLVTRDKVLDVPRDRLRWWLEHRKEARTGRSTPQVWQSKLAYLVGCSWCAGIWVSGAVVGVTAWLGSVPYPLLMWGSAASLVGLISDHEPD